MPRARMAEALPCQIFMNLCGFHTCTTNSLLEPIPLCCTMHSPHCTSSAAVPHTTNRSCWRRTLLAPNREPLVTASARSPKVSSAQSPTIRDRQHSSPRSPPPNLGRNLNIQRRASHTMRMGRSRPRRRGDRAATSGVGTVTAETSPVMGHTRPRCRRAVGVAGMRCIWFDASSDRSITTTLKLLD